MDVSGETMMLYNKCGYGPVYSAVSVKAANETALAAALTPSLG